MDANAQELAAQRAARWRHRAKIHASVDRYVKLSVTASAAAGGSIREPLREQPCLWYSLRLR